jgi:hypothetical protein
MIENAEARATYRTWTAMRHRCNTPKNPSFHNYGGRGIRVCAEWADSFAAFVRDMGMRPAGMCLDRIDNDGHYEPGNCRWTTFAVNSRNRRSNRNFTFNGQTKCITDWARELGVSASVISKRLAEGMTFEQAIAKPVRKIRNWRTDPLSRRELRSA